MEIPYDKLAKIYTNCSGHMTKIATIPIYVKKPLKFFSRTRRPITLGLGMYICSIENVGLTNFYMNDNSGLTFTYFTERSNLIPNALNGKESGSVHFSITVKAEILIPARNV